MKNVKVVGLITLLAALACVPGGARNQKLGKAARGAIVSLNPAERTVALGSVGAFLVDTAAQILVNGRPSNLNDLAVGMASTLVLDRGGSRVLKVMARDPLPGEVLRGSTFDLNDSDKGRGRGAIPGTVVGVGSHTITIDGQGNKPVTTIFVSDDARIHVNGTQARLWDIREGMQATLVLDRSRSQAVKIMAHDTHGRNVNSEDRGQGQGTPRRLTTENGTMMMRMKWRKRKIMVVNTERDMVTDTMTRIDRFLSHDHRTDRLTGSD